MKIVTDSAADLPIEDVQNHGITVAPLLIQFPEGEVSSDNITSDQFYTRLREMEPNVPTTSQPSSGYFAQIYRQLAAAGEEILSIHISSGLSGTIESARAGAQQASEALVTDFDTLTLSGGERFHVLAAAMGAKAGWTKDMILERLKAIRAATEVIFTLETISYLARGGRIGRVQAIAGTLLKIKPIIHVDKSDGKYSSVGRGRTVTKALEVIAGHLSSTYGSTPLWVSVMHGQFLDQAEALAKMLRERVNVGKLEILRISPVLGVHTGPGIVGAAVVPMNLMEGIG